MPGVVLALAFRTGQTQGGGVVQGLRVGCSARVRRESAQKARHPAAAGPVRERAGAEGTTMQELRFVAVSEDGQYAVLGVPGRSARFTLPIDERLRAVALGQTSRLAQYEIEVESPLRPKEIQARIRAGETVEEIADAAGIAIERVRWFEGPVLAERAYTADQAQKASVRRQGDATPGPRLGEIVAERMKLFGADPDDAQWDAKKRGDGSWLVQLDFITDGRLHTAEWIFDPRRRHVTPADDNAARMSLPGIEPPQPAAPAPGEATVTHLAPRLGTASGNGPSGMGNSAMASAGHGGSAIGNGLGNGLGSGGRARHERPGSTRPAVPEPKVADQEAPQPREQQPREQQAREYEPREPEAPAAAAGRRRDGHRSPAGWHSPGAWMRPRGTRARLRTPASRRTPGPLRRARRRRRHRQPRTPPRWPRLPLRRYQPPRRYLPPRRPRRPRGKPSANRRRARAGRRRAGGGPRCRPGTRSCSATRASETSQARVRRTSLGSR